jgi:hypothetical protein
MFLHNYYYEDAWYYVKRKEVNKISYSYFGFENKLGIRSRNFSKTVPISREISPKRPQISTHSAFRHVSESLLDGCQ